MRFQKIKNTIFAILPFGKLRNLCKIMKPQNNNTTNHNSTTIQKNVTDSYSVASNKYIKYLVFRFLKLFYIALTNNNWIHFMYVHTENQQLDKNDDTVSQNE